uniref:(R)-citramalate synthase CimA n=1 Tax=Candidatus Methanophagaceae archaeon ANME-1 ERB6 TaxID=2759912 RepID=A0A7G9YSS4_9EURY|nr:(R)-citramalate synthase CimA [Methanosarcinales archaeon ANME-1 ERB6]
MQEQKTVKILDTSLRDGEQTPGVSLTPEQKLQIAKQLDILGVDYIEAGTAVISEGEQRGIKGIANEGLKAEISSFARLLKGDIDAAIECDVDTVNLVAPVSDAHIKKKLKTDRESLRNRTLEMVDYVKGHGLKVEISAEDASRADTGFLKSFFSDLAAVVDRLCFCDTVGILYPERTKELFELICDFNTPVAVHCHNDFGLATVNSVAAVLAGAEVVHVTVNGLGERAGNASLEEVVTALELLYGMKTNIVKSKLYETSRLVGNLTKVPVAPNKPLVGDNVFTHESGMHVHGTLADTTLYEPMDPGIVGRKRRFAFGKHTGTASVKMALEEQGIQADKEQMSKILAKVKELGDKGKLVTDADFQAVVDDVLRIERGEKIKLVDLSVVSGKNVYPTASIRLEIDGEDVVEAAVGVGPVDAAINALKKGIRGMEMADLRLEEYHVDAITGGADALVNVVVKMSRRDRTITASGVSEDIVLASLYALINGVNRLYQ